MLRTPIRFAVLIATMVAAAEPLFAARPNESERGEREARVSLWRRDALETMRAAVTSRMIVSEDELARYKAAGFNTLIVFDNNGRDANATSWKVKSAEQIQSETMFARDHATPLVVGLPTEEFVAADARVAQLSDAQIAERVRLWKQYGDDVIIGVFPWYDDVFVQKVDVERQRQVYAAIKAVAPRWFVFGMIGEYGGVASDDEVSRRFSPDAFDHLIVLMYPFNVGARLTGFPLDATNAVDADRDIALYIDDYLGRMDNRFFGRLREGQLIVLVTQAFYWNGEPQSSIPRPNDVAIMMQHGSERVRTLHGQSSNFAIACYWWGEEGADVVGLSQRPDWIAAARTVNDRLAHERFVRVP